MIVPELGFDPEVGHPEEPGEVRTFEKMRLENIPRERAEKHLMQMATTFSATLSPHRRITREYVYEYNDFLYAEVFYGL